MEDVLKSLYIKLDTTAQSLTKDAIGQLLIKILYSNVSMGISKREVLSQYKNITKNNPETDGIEFVLDNLVERNEIKLARGKYHLSTNKRTKIEKSLNQSMERIDYIVDRYFCQLHSKKEDVKAWFQKTLIFFFQQYSENWISDLCYHAGYKDKTIQDITKMLELRTRNDKTIDPRDYSRMSASFANMLRGKDSYVDELFWEYGTSQFAAKLISKGDAADKITLDTFSGAYCVLDTNILMHIGLEASEYYEHLSSIEAIFQKLHVKVGVLDVTKKEYERTVSNKRDDILRMFDSYSCMVIEGSSDQYIQTAKKRMCRGKEDYERFFQPLLHIPQKINSTLEISLFDDSLEVENAVYEAQKDETRCNELNSIYKEITGKDKRQNALLHDVGMIAGVNELRKSGGKYFILSQEASVNGYAKQQPCDCNLPMAVKIETLINVLAINNVNGDRDSYVSLFASIIRMNLQPNRETFQINDLSYILEKNQQVAQLPPESVKKIAIDIHQRRMRGEDDEVLQKEMARLLQGEKMKVVSDLEDTQRELSLEREDKKRVQQQSDRTHDALVAAWRKEKKNEINGKIIQYCLLALLVVPGAAICLWLAIYHCTDCISTLPEKVISIAIDALLAIGADVIKIIPKLITIVKTREQSIQEYINEQNAQLIQKE